MNTNSSLTCGQHLLSRIEYLLEKADTFPRPGEFKLDQEVKSIWIGNTDIKYTLPDNYRLTRDMVESLILEFYESFGCSVEFSKGFYETTTVAINKPGEDFPIAFGTLTLISGRLLYVTIRSTGKYSDPKLVR
ncbi:MAG: hypothetical protein WCV55_03580 [Candidatus Paceibacterota bacterium]